MSSPRAALEGALRTAALVALVLAFVDLGSRESQMEAATTDSTLAWEPNPGRVAVRVDGWIIEVDGVKAAALPQPEPRPAPKALIAQVRRPSAILSRYDDLIHAHAASHGLDWRLVAALIQEESAFRPEAVSDKGAVGLMQVRAIAAEDVGESAFRLPSDNIRTGVRYLDRLTGIFAAAGDGSDRLALVLAAYNMGPAHVQDAQLLARTFGYDPYRWDNAMALMLPLLEDPRFHRRLPSGYAQGRAAVTYVERILARYERFKVEAGDVPGLAVPRRQATSARG